MGRSTHHHVPHDTGFPAFRPQLPISNFDITTERTPGAGGLQAKAGADRVQATDPAGQAGQAGMAFVVASFNGAATIAATVAACARQAHTFVVSDGSADDTVGA